MMKTFSIIFAALLVTICNAESFSCPDALGTCNKCTNYNGQVLALTRDFCPGDKYDQDKCIQMNGPGGYTCSDGCNKCTCGPGGVSATLMFCSHPSKLNECTDVGTSWKCGENTTCYCTPDGIAYGP